ncbi:MAG: NADH:ubiquinone reductase (Na(+)-transporting) subunit C [Fidelibacterota bacterium]|jgi:Na+-transporting NADH:ubiquinone oxidoreductase subunit C
MRSNSYTLIFTSLITIFLGFLLSVAATSLKPLQDINIEIDMKKNILGALGIEPTLSEKWTIPEVQDVYQSSILGLVLDKNGNKTDKNPKEIDTEKDKNFFPIYLHQVDGQVNGYVIPISGKGLWSTLYGYFAIDIDCETAKGITFYKHGETPGLGGEVEKPWFQNNFIGKKFVNNDNELVGIQVVKGSVDKTSEDAYRQVDGISGATITSKGLEVFLKEDLAKYEPFFKTQRKAIG